MHGEGREDAPALGDVARCRGATSRWAGTPSIVAPVERITRPRAASASPETVRSVVVLPAPFAPISVTISPSRTSRETPWSASTAP